jgi:hypothetical protein
MSTRNYIQIKTKNTLFDYVLTQRPTHAEITIQFFTPFYTTKPLPQTITILETLLPRIFQHKCFNNCNRSFKAEATETELGHLFDHIMLEYLGRFKFDSEGNTKIKLRGLTEWDWLQDPKGIFHISLNSKIEDSYLLQKSIQQTTQMMESILLSNTTLTLPQTHLRKSA